MANMVIDGEIYDGDTGELINTIEQVEAPIIEAHLPAIVCKGGTHIQVNTEQLKNELVEYLKKYDIEVTEETEKEASKKATELNKLADDLNKARLHVGREIKKPADELKEKVDELIDIIQGRRKSILEKVDVFKQNRFDTIRTLLKHEAGLLYQLHGVEKEYQKADIEKLVVESSLAKVALSKKAVDALEGMVLKCKNIQSNVKIRLLELPLKGQELTAPLTRYDVEHILELDDFEYSEALAKLIQNRLDVERRVEEARLAKEAQQAQAVKAFEEKKEALEKAKQEEVGVKIVEITAIFRVEVSTSVDNARVIEKYKTALAEKFSTLVSVR